MDSIQEEKYKVYNIVPTTAPSGATVYTLLDTHKTFDNQDDAIQWTINEGERFMEYTIMKTFRKM